MVPSMADVETAKPRATRAPQSVQGAAMEKARKRAGLTKSQVAKTLGVNRNMVGLWEHNGDLKLSIALRLADLYGVTLDQLVGRSPLPD